MSDFVVIAAIAGLVLSQLLWLRNLRFLVNTALSRNPAELRVREGGSKDQQRPKHDPRPRPDGL